MTIDELHQWETAHLPAWREVARSREFFCICQRPGANGQNIAQFLWQALQAALADRDELKDRLEVSA